MDIEVIVEIPQGSRNKYEMDHDSGRIRLDRLLFTSTRYPADNGFVTGTLAEDGDPLDALVLLGEPTFPGCVITARPVGVFWMEVYKELEPGKGTDARGWQGRAAAEQEIGAAIARCRGDSGAGRQIRWTGGGKATR